MRITRVACATLAAVALLVACGRPGDRPAAFTVVDSAGVRVATSTRPRWAEGDGWRLSPQPVLEIGSASGDDAYLLADAVGVSRLADGRHVVCNRGDRTLRYYASDGAYLGRVAGEGGGPGELRSMRLCIRRGPETWVYQAPAQPVAVFDDEGVLVRTVTMPRPDGRPATLVDVYADGSLLVEQRDFVRQPPAGVSVVEGTLLRVAPDGSLAELGRFSLERRVRGERLSFSQAFTPRLTALALDEGALVSWPEGPVDLSVLADDGRILRRIRTTVAPAPVTDAHRSDYRERILDGPMPVGDLPLESDDVRRAIVDMMVYPGRLPVHHRILSDASGHLWVERGDAPRDPFPQLRQPHPDPTTWDVFTPDGEWLGPVTMPARFGPLEIGADYVLGVHADELGVERVRMHALERGG